MFGIRGPSQETQEIDIELGQAAKYLESLCAHQHFSLVAMAKLREAKFVLEHKVEEITNLLLEMLRNFKEEMLGNQPSEEQVNVDELLNSIQEAIENLK